MAETTFLDENPKPLHRAAGSRDRTMTAAVVTGARQFKIERVPLPVPATGQVRIRLDGCGVCGSNLVPWSGPKWMQFPVPPGGLGHEGWGTIDEVGIGVDRSFIGQRVATLSERSYAQYDVAGLDAIVPIPDALGSRPFPGEPLGCAMNIFKRSRIEAGDRVAIVGVGFLGALLVQLAATAGARVIAISRRATALDLARRYGAETTVPMHDHEQIINTVKEVTDGKFCNRVIETAGAQWPLDLSAELTSVRGRLVIAGYHQDGSRSVNMQLWNWRGLDVINAHERERAAYVHGMNDAIGAILSGRLDPYGLYTHRYSLDRLGQALDDATTKPDGFMKALILYT